MKPLYFLLLSLLSATSTAALADDGSDRARQFLTEFRQQQQQIHGSQAVAQQSSASAETPSQEDI